MHPRLKLMVADLHRCVPRHLTWAPLAAEPTLLDDNINQHSRIRGALERRDSEAARRWMTDHVLRSADLVVAWFERQRRDADSTTPDA
jgi:DNA-binding GntR family transcriptional regulator